MLNMSRISSRGCSATTSFSGRALGLEDFDFAGGRRPLRIAGEAVLAGFLELLRLSVVEALGDAFAAAELGFGRVAA